ncbi:MAG TPA: ubiquinol-cytochrome c reductase iron-sulfur subunit [Stellaceae bacterium]|nr:ubiquinol-cytochrome c reductase iron-sulfur subunit [Stellaceae bacterium]
MSDVAQSQVSHGHDGETRRDFLTLTATAVGVVGAACAIWPFIDSLNPAKDTLALSTTDVDLSPIQVGQRLTVAWQGAPAFISHRTADEIKAAQNVDISTLRDPQTDAQRVKQSTFNGKVMSEWLIVKGVCTHLGCIPLGQKPTDDRGAFGGWFCPCHGSVYDTSGRRRDGPAPRNLEVPTYKFTSDTAITIG